MRILALESYFGGSHARFLNDLARQDGFEVEIRSLPARAWKWRMRFAALHFADELRERPPRNSPDLILVSTFLDLAQLKSFLPSALRDLPVVLYWHENQFAYPVRKEDERDRHFVVTNLLSARAADLNLFNSAFNRRSLMEALPAVLGPAPDMELGSVAAALERSEVFPVPIDIEAEPPSIAARPDDGPPIVLWNHRWEHDKNPEDFFAALFELKARGRAFRLAVAGQSFREVPEIFAEARSRLADEIVHWGLVEERADYIRLLRRCSLVVSTARHDFYGLSLLEAAVQGAEPLAPRRLAYPEIYPDHLLFEDAELADRLEASLMRPPCPDPELVTRLAERSWTRLLPRLKLSLEALVNPR